MATIDDVYSKVTEVHRVVTKRVIDVGAPNGLDLATAVRRLLLITRRSEARETRLLAVIEALAATSNANQTEIMAKVDEALAAIEELDEDLPEDMGAGPAPTPSA